MNKLFLIFGILVFAGISFAQVVPDGSLDSSLAKVYCHRVALLPQLRSGAASYSSTYTSDINSALSDVSSSISTLREDCMYNDRSSFNSDYRAEFLPAANTVKSLFFKSALEYMRLNPGATSMAEVMDGFNDYMADYQSCINSRPIRYCQTSVS